MIKRYIRLVALVAVLLPGLAQAAAVCTCAATNNSTQTAILAASTAYARKQICLQNVSVVAADYVACNIGNTSAVSMTTGIILPAQSATSAILVPPFCFPPAQYSSNTFPIVPSGAVNCIAAAGTPAVCACTW